MRNSNNSRFLINAFPQRQDSQASILSNTDYGVSGCLNYLTGASKVVLWTKVGHKEVKNLNC